MPEFLSNRKSNRRSNFIKSRVILSYGNEVAKVIVDAYLSDTKEAKLVGINKIASLTTIRNHRKVNHIKEVLLGPKNIRISIAKQVKKVIDG